MKVENDDNYGNGMVVIDGPSLENDIKRVGITTMMGDVVIPSGGDVQSLSSAPQERRRREPRTRPGTVRIPVAAAAAVANVDVVAGRPRQGRRRSRVGRPIRHPAAAATPLGGLRRRGLMGTSDVGRPPSTPRMGETTAEEYDDNNDGRATLPVNARPSVVALLPPESATSAIASDTVGRTMIRPTFPPKLYTMSGPAAIATQQSIKKATPWRSAGTHNNKFDAAARNYSGSSVAWQRRQQVQQQQQLQRQQERQKQKQQQKRQWQSRARARRGQGEGKARAREG